jgi:hypothetical protein
VGEDENKGLVEEIRAREVQGSKRRRRGTSSSSSSIRQKFQVGGFKEEEEGTVQKRITINFFIFVIVLKSTAVETKMAV